MSKRIEDLPTHYPTVDYYPAEGLNGDGQPYVRMDESSLIGNWISRNDLPPLRDAKTDPPDDERDVSIYAKGKYAGLGNCLHGRSWRMYSGGGPAFPSEWSEILHW